MSRKTILLADDEPDLRGLIRDTILQSFKDVQILEARDGGEAFTKLKNQKFDVAVIDLSMPKMEGQQILKALSIGPASQRPGKILVYSAHSSADEIHTNFGKDVDFIAKPATAQTLIDYFAKALGAQKAAAPRMDLAIVNTFIDSTLEVLQTMAKVKSQKDSLFIRGKDAVSGDISAIISIVSPKQRGSMAISFEESCFLYVVGELLGEKQEKIGPENSDAAAELCNQIFGITKRRLNEMGWELQPAIPTVITGPGHRIQHQAAGPCIAVRFSTPSGFFTIETALEVV